MTLAIAIVHASVSRFQLKRNTVAHTHATRGEMIARLVVMCSHKDYLQRARATTANVCIKLEREREGDDDDGNTEEEKKFVRFIENRK